MSTKKPLLGDVGPNPPTATGTEDRHELPDVPLRKDAAAPPPGFPPLQGGPPVGYGALMEAARRARAARAARTQGGPPVGGFGAAHPVATVPTPPDRSSGAPPPGDGHGAPPAAERSESSATPSGASAEHGVVPWEDANLGLFDRWWRTVKAVSFAPRAFYRAAPASVSPAPAVSSTTYRSGPPQPALPPAGDGGNPWPAIGSATLNGALGGTANGVFWFLIQVWWHEQTRTRESLGMLGSPAIVIRYAFLGALAGLILPWIQGGVEHLALQMLGGATCSYAHTVRVNAYGRTASFWLWVPWLGIPLALILSAAADVVGLDETHQCGTGKALAAVLLPMLCGFCACGTSLVLAFVWVLHLKWFTMFG